MPFIQVKSSILTSLCGFHGCLSLVGGHDILFLGKSPIKCGQLSGMTISVDWDVKHHF